MQKTILINNNEVHIIEEGENTYYPINFIFEKLLDKILPKGKKSNDKYKNQYILKNTMYENNPKNIQPTKCLEYKHCKELFSEKNFNFNTFTEESLLNYNAIVDHFGIDSSKRRSIVNTSQGLNKDNYGEYEWKVIERYLEEYKGEEIKYVTCSMCSSIYPFDNVFFSLNNKHETGLSKSCKYCGGGRLSGQDKNKYWLSQYDKELYNIYKEYGEEVMELKIKDDKQYIINIYEQWLGDINSSKHMPKYINNREAIEIIIKHLYVKGKISKETLTSHTLENKYKINLYNYNLTMEDIYRLLFGNEPFEKPYLYPKLTLKGLDIEVAITVFNNYLIDNGIVIDDVYSFDYGKIALKCGIRNYTDNKLLDFVMEYNDNKYGAYKFKITSPNYWTVKENRVQALKFFIEKDMKIPLDKIPLYLTKNALRKHDAEKLYKILYHKKYYNNIWNWIEECYEGKFVELDFVINKYKEEFDSDEEMLVDEQLRILFKNVIYNSRKDTNAINIEGMNPDFMIMTNKGCCLVEYFGLYVERKNNSITQDYIMRTNKKLIKYEKLKENGYYNFIGLYPEDLDNDYSGMKEKLKLIG